MFLAQESNSYHKKTIAIFLLLLLQNSSFAQTNSIKNNDPLLIDKSQQKTVVSTNGETIIVSSKSNMRDTIKFQLPGNTLMTTEEYEKWKKTQIIENVETHLPE